MKRIPLSVGALASSLLLLFGLSAQGAAVKTKNYELSSPGERNSISVSVGENLTYSVLHGGTFLLKDNEISMTLSDGTVYGGGEGVRKVSRRSVNETLPTVIYKKKEVKDNFNEMTLSFKRYSVIFRAYDDGVAYRFVSNEKGAFQVKDEVAQFNFPADFQMYVPYVTQNTETLDSQFFNSFENTYTHTALSKWNKDRLAFLPLVVEENDGVKVLITESDLLDYPGMYLYNWDSDTSLHGVFAPYPKDVQQGGHNMLQGLVKTREDFIAKYDSGVVSFPWRTMIISDNDKDLASSDMVWRLGRPSEGDFSWVRPGKVAWDWWNDWNIYGVDFRAGINNDTYKYYIDFASKNGIEYVILDEGWAVNMKADLMQVIDEIDVQELCSYAEKRGVGIILWAGYWAFNRDIEGVCKHYSKMGVKGFKIDFMDRDDQQILDFYVRAASIAAKYHMMVDFHGAFKPAGIHRTYPNVINFEGVHGLENMKWSRDADQVTYDVTLPFIRCVAGPMDYTQGAMRNATRGNYHPVNSEAMSQGTRVHQLAEYVIFDSPLNMLCDSPSNYLQEPECTRFIAEIPTTWDETLVLDGQMAKYIVTARRKGDTWYVGALGNWDARDITINLPSAISRNLNMEVFRDGVNADRVARDYRKETLPVPSDGKLTIHLAPGGGWVAKIK